MLNINRYIIVIVLSTLFTFAQSDVSASEPVKFSDTISIAQTTMDLQGLGQKNFLFMKAFVAAFYLEDGVDTENVLGDVGKSVEVSYFLPIGGDKLTGYTYDKMKENLTAQEFSQISDELEQMAEYFPDLKSGDRYSLTYVPGTGTKFIYNGDLLGIIEDPLFAKGVFSVWIGDNPMDKKIRDQILGYKSLNADREKGISIVSAPVDPLEKLYSILFI